MKNLKNADISIEDIPSEIFVCRLIADTFIIVQSNEMALHSISMSKEDVLGKDILELLGVKEFNFLDILYEAQNSSKIVPFDIPCYVNDKLCRWHKGSVKKLFNGDLLLYYQNIEREKELEIEDLQYKFDLVSEAPYVGICIFTDRFLYVNHVLEGILGYSFGDMKNITPIDLLHLDNKEEYICNLGKRLNGDKFTTTYLDAKLLKKNAKEISTRLCVKTIKYRGKFAAFASVIDISRLVEQEQKTKRLAQALEQTDDLLLITDPEGKIIDVNKMLIEKTAYTKEELIGAKTNIFKSGKHSRRFYKRLWNTLLSGEKYSNMLINRTKKGKLIYLDTIITPVFDKAGKLESFVSTAKDVSYQMKMKKRLKNLAMMDMLTKISNRYAIDKEIDYHLHLANRYETPFALLMLDIDYFKKINDTYGHYIGDIVLKKSVKVLKQSIRKIDKIGRWGGEEFIIILHGASKDDALQKAEELRAVIENNLINKQQSITISIGVALFEKNDTRESLVHRVDDALYQAKEQGRNRVAIL